ncbi:MAG TPA: BTAD domain-containing putative transcriptional regulator [Acidimicrobiia bacterium]|nr:BTAD domain-containing putative transcriptional regulator [Acidimicrobiia bacterium]
MVRIYLMGRVAIEGPAAVVDEAALPGPLGRVLLALLAVDPGPVARSRVAQVLWDDDPPAAYERSLNPLLSKLRRALATAGADRELFVSGSGAVGIRRRAELWIDVNEATTALDAAEGALRRGRPHEAWPRAAVATSILGRPFLEGVDLRWVADQRRSLHDRLIRAHEAAADVWIQLDDPGQAVVAARRLVEADPFRETGYERLIRAHVLAGNRAEALRTFAECEATLRHELGVDPSPLVQAAYEEALGVAN